LIPMEEWEWFGHKQHLCVATKCQFSMSTRVGNIVVSTVGEYREKPDDKDWATIGCGRLYETMTFHVHEDSPNECGCPGWHGEAEWFDGYNDARSAQEGHMEICRKVARL